MSPKPLRSHEEIKAAAQESRVAKHAAQRKRGVKAKNAKRGGHRFPGNVDTRFRQWLRAQPCFLFGAAVHPVCRGFFTVSRPTTEVMHITSRGAGGEDFDNCVPACPALHDESHRIGIKSFAAKYGVRLKAAAQRYGSRFLKETGSGVGAGVGKGGT